MDNLSNLNSLLEGELMYDGVILEVNSAQIFDFGSNNFSDNHYEYLQMENQVW